MCALPPEWQRARKVSSCCFCADEATATSNGCLETHVRRGIVVRSSQTEELTRQERKLDRKAIIAGPGTSRRDSHSEPGSASLLPAVSFFWQPCLSINQSILPSCGRISSSQKQKKQDGARQKWRPVCTKAPFKLSRDRLQ